MSNKVNRPSDNSFKLNGAFDGPLPTGSGSALNPRSCVTCRRRKVKCDKKNPCSNCVRTKIECVFPRPGRAPRKSRKLPDAELLERLRRLEGVVSNLNAQVEEHEQEAADREKGSQNGNQNHATSNSTSAGPTHGPRVVTDNSVEGLESRFGRLVVEKGRSRYINDSFWASLNNEVEDLKAILVEPSDDGEDPPLSELSNFSSHQNFLFRYSSTNVDLQLLHPEEQQARQLWEVYKESVDPLVKVLHIPTFESTFSDAIGRAEKVPRSLEALLFTIYYGAVTSTASEICLSRWGEDRTTLLTKYRFGLEQALARANFLYCDEIVILQAFVVFLALLRRNDDARKIWTLTGLAVRIAQTLGLHRDGSHFGLPPFEIEMRRRLWWQVCILDSRSSEDHGCDPTIVEAQFDTKMPLNVNDADLQPEMANLPEERQGFTDMSFVLLRFQVASTFRRILFNPPGSNMSFTNLPIADKEQWIVDTHRRMEDKFLKNCDLSQPLQWVTATVSRLVMSKMWLILYHPHQRRDGGTTLPQETRDRLFITSLENLEYSILLETEARTMKWGWLFRTYIQWHAIAFLLSELCVRTRGEAVERAWKAFEAIESRWWFPLSDEPSQHKVYHSALWKPLRKLLAKARAAREKELAVQRGNQSIENAKSGFGFPQSSTRTVPPSSLDPASENLDKLLRPCAPRLGESSETRQSSWPICSSPALSQTPQSASQSPMSSHPGDGMSRQRPLPSKNMNTLQRHNSCPGGKFTGLSNFGLNGALRDVMVGMTPDGSVLNSDYANVSSGLVGNDVAAAFQTPPPNIPPNPAIYSACDPVNNTSQPRMEANIFANASMTFNATPPILDDDNNNNTNNNNNGQLLHSPMLDDGNMDWALWDDMVTQYGIEGQAPNPTITGVNSLNGLNGLNGLSGLNGSGHVGMMHWF